jgi:hypothetical protein
VIERRKGERRRNYPPAGRDLAQYAHIMSAIALTAVVFLVTVGFLENRERQAEVKELAVQVAVANCLASERVASALREVIEVTIDTRNELGDPDAAVFEERYRQVLDEYLRPRQCA